MTVIPDQRGASLAVLLLFTTEPSDRALEGWCAGEDWCAEEMVDLGLPGRRGRR